MRLPVTLSADQRKSLESLAAGRTLAETVRDLIDAAAGNPPRPGRAKTVPEVIARLGDAVFPASTLPDAPTPKSKAPPPKPTAKPKAQPQREAPPIQAGSAYGSRLDKSSIGRRITPKAKPSRTR